MDKYDILVRQIKKEIKNNNGANINELVLDAIENARKIDSRHGINEFFRIAGHEVKWPNREEIFKIFLDNGLTIDFIVLEYAVSRIPCLKILINYGVSITKIMNHMFQYGYRKKNKELFDFYFDEIIKTQEYISEENITNFLIMASYYYIPTLEQIKILINMGADPRASNDILFLNSCRKNDLDMINYFLFECGCDVNTHYIDVSGRRKDALIILLESLQDRTIKYLEIGSSVILPNMTENYDTIKKLIDFGIKITDDTILCGLRNPDILSLFLKNGIDPEHIGKLIIDKDLKRNYMHFSALKSLAKIGVDLNQLIINTN